jgi:mono/diheme cytochrome c family protein
MPEFGDKLKPEELKAVSVYVFSQAGKEAEVKTPQ